ncbi:MAG: hypothetical protein GW913_13130 [Myxococcales bacterium]|nr:hypothetical protein [Myxococcales bacterium]
MKHAHEPSFLRRPSLVALALTLALPSLGCGRTVEPASADIDSSTETTHDANLTTAVPELAPSARTPNVAHDAPAAVPVPSHDARVGTVVTETSDGIEIARMPFTIQE